VVEAFRGAAVEGEIMEIRQFGGQLGSLEAIYDDRLTFNEGDDLVLFLYDITDRLRPAYLLHSRHSAYYFPPPTMRRTDVLGENHVLESVSDQNSLPLTAGDLKIIAATPIFVEISQTEWKTSEGEAEVRIEVIANHPWSAYSSEEWLTVTRRGDSVRLEAEANATYFERTANVKFVTGDVVETLTATQAARRPLSITVSPITMELRRGALRNITAIVEGLCNPPQTVTWNNVNEKVLCIGCVDVIECC